MTDTLMEFPCRFPIKVMGSNRDGFVDDVKAAVEAQAGPVADEDVREQPSSNGRFLAVTVTFEATSQDQVDTIYRAMQEVDQVKVVL